MCKYEVFIRHCLFQGRIRGQSKSYVAISTCHGGINGIVYDDKNGGSTYFIHPPQDNVNDEHLLLRYVACLRKNKLIII